MPNVKILHNQKKKKRYAEEEGVVASPQGWLTSSTVAPVASRLSRPQRLHVLHVVLGAVAPLRHLCELQQVPHSVASGVRSSVRTCRSKFLCE